MFMEMATETAAYWEEFLGKYIMPNELATAARLGEFAGFPLLDKGDVNGLNRARLHLKGTVVSNSKFNASFLSCCPALMQWIPQACVKVLFLWARK